MKIVKTSKDLVSKSLTSLGIKVLAVIACVSYAFGVVLASVMSKTRLTGNKEKKGTLRGVNNSLPEVGLTYSSAIYFIYRCSAHDSVVTSFSG